MKIIAENVIEQFKMQIPLDWSLSKNRSKTRNSHTGAMVFNANQKQIDNLGNEIFYISKSEGCVWKPKSKVWIFITAYKKNNKGDCANFLDAISDAVKKALMIDDCWFSFVIDYKIDSNEKIEISILQEAEGGDPLP